jgi:two-component system CheB/CheR fusion protein
MNAKAVRKGTPQDVAKPEIAWSVAHENDTTIVAIGASAGGIEALSELMTHLPSDTGMAFVLVQHLHPKHHSILTELLARKTAMTLDNKIEGVVITIVDIAPGETGAKT